MYSCYRKGWIASVRLCHTCCSPFFEWRESGTRIGFLSVWSTSVREGHRRRKGFFGFGILPLVAQRTRNLCVESDRIGSWISDYSDRKLLECTVKCSGPLWPEPAVIEWKRKSSGAVLFSGKRITRRDIGRLSHYCRDWTRAELNTEFDVSEMIMLLRDG